MLIHTGKKKFWTQQPVWGKATGAGGAYTGPGDILAFTAWLGLRAYSAAKAAALGAIVDLQDQAGANPITINSTTAGALDTAAIATWVAAHSVTTIKVSKLYDQVGTNHFVQATLATMPVLTPNALNTSYGMTFAGAQKLIASTNIAIVPTLSVSMVAERTSGTAAFGTVFSVDNGGGIQTGFSNSANNALIYAGTVVSVPSVTESAFHAINVAYNGASSIYQIDALTGTVSPGVASTTVDTPIIGGAGGGNALTGIVMEVGYLLTTLFSAGNETSLNTNQHAAYGGF